MCSIHGVNSRSVFVIESTVWHCKEESVQFLCGAVDLKMGSVVCCIDIVESGCFGYDFLYEHFFKSVDSLQFCCCCFLLLLSSLFFFFVVALLLPSFFFFLHLPEVRIVSLKLQQHICHCSEACFWFAKLDRLSHFHGPRQSPVGNLHSFSSEVVTNAGYRLIDTHSALGAQVIKDCINRTLHRGGEGQRETDKEREMQFVCVCVYFVYFVVGSMCGCFVECFAVEFDGTKSFI